MIKFFRQIRQRLLSESKFSKYLLYAIGEIILVVIGILIALQLNNWNANRIVHEKQLDHLRLIKKEMSNNLQALKSEEKELSQILDKAKKIIGIIDTDTVSESQLSSLLSGLVSQDIEVFFENGALNQILTSDGLKDIENDSIRDILASWDGKIAYVKRQELEVTNHQKALTEFLAKNADIRALFENIGLSKRFEFKSSTQIASNKSLLESKQLESRVLLLTATAYGLEAGQYQKLGNEIIAIIELIDTELELN